MIVVTKPTVAARSFPSQGIILDVEQRPVDATGWIWRLNAANARTLRWDTLEVSSPAIFEAIVRYVRAVVESSSPTHAFNTFNGMKLLSRSEIFRRVDADDDVLPLAILTEILQQGAADTWRLHYIRQLYYWGADWRHPNFSPEVAFEAKLLRIPKNRNGVAVRSADPADGPLTDLELTALVNALTAAESEGSLSAEEIAALWLSISFGPNPIQMTLLREENFITFPDEHGRPVFYHLDVPRMKKRGMALRGAFRRRPLSVETGIAIQRLIDHNANVRRNWPEEVAQDIWPLFPADRPSRLLLNGPMHEYAMHMVSANFSQMIASAVEKLGVISHRTGEPLHVFSRRLRYTFATRLVREGVSKREVADLLDHSDLQSVQIYFDIKSDIVAHLDRAMAMSLGPIAQAFMGKIISGPDQADRGSDPRSKIALLDTQENAIREVGNCGSFGFCRQLSPVACYTCAAFQPWIDGPHHILLDDLLKDRARKQAAGQDGRMVTLLDGTILAIADVVSRIETVRESKS